MTKVQETIKLKALGYIISLVVELRIIFIVKKHYKSGNQQECIWYISYAPATVLTHAGTKMRWQLLACRKFIILLGKTVIAHQTSTGQSHVDYKPYRHPDSS